jgi:DNA polymerase
LPTAALTSIRKWNLFLVAPPLTPLERRVWELDQAINLRGFHVDRPLVKTVLRMIAEESTALLERCAALTAGKVRSAAQRDAVLEWLEDHGVYLPDLRKKTVEDALADGLADGPAREMLEIRAASSKTSTAKYQAFEFRSRHDSRLRDILKYHTASTGRWGGAGVQPQNFPRGSIKNSVQAAEILRDGDLELVRLLYGNPMEVFSSCLRNMIVAPKGKILDVADYASIEVRVLFWLARHTDGVQAFYDGRPLYEELAANIFGVEASEVLPDQRFLGKQATLGCGYGMGAKKFRATCQALGREVSEDLAEAAVRVYRTTHAPVTALWKNLERAAFAAVENPGKKYTINRTSWFVSKGFLWCELPGKRRLAYYRPEVVWEESHWGKRPTLYHWGVDALPRKWARQKTYGGKLTENVVQAIARDLMAEAMLRIEDAGPWEIVLSVHDELIAERDLKSDGSLDRFCELMETLPAWAEGCPIAVEGWSGARYHK